MCIRNRLWQYANINSYIWNGCAAAILGKETVNSIHNYEYRNIIGEICI